MRRIDSRVSLLISVLAGVLIWQYGCCALVTVLVIEAGLLLSFVPLSLCRGFFRQSLMLIVIWAGASAGTDFLAGVEPRVIVSNAVILAVRLMDIFLLGALLMRLHGALELARSLVWFLYPVLKARAIMIGIALLMMINALARQKERVFQVRDALRLRLMHRSWFFRLHTGVRRILEELPHEADIAAEAILSRHLDVPSVWIIHRSFDGYSLLTGTFGIGLEIILLLID